MPLSYPGLANIVRWTFTHSHGITPSLCRVDVVPQVQLPQVVGDLNLTWGAASWTFAGCVVDRASVRRSNAGTIVGLTLFDRRWKWQFGDISGLYNQRALSGDIDTSTEKTPRELAGLLLDALGESGYSTADLPNDVRPAVAWNHASPAVELDRLCELLGCRVVLGLDNHVALRRTGQGNLLPLLGIERRESLGIDPANRPSALRLVGGVTLYQTRFRLEAVGLERDGRLLPIEQLSYRPATGWGSEWPFLGNVANAAERRLALQSVFRWYRILCTAPDNAEGIFHIPGCDEPVDGLWQVLPLENRLVETGHVSAESETRRAPVIDGLYYPLAADGQNLTENRAVPPGWTLDTELGVVRFDVPIVRRGAGEILEPAELYLTVAHPVRSRAHRQPLRYEFEQPLAGALAETGPKVVLRDDLVELVKGAPIPASGAPSQNQTSPERNTSTLAAAAQAFAAALDAEFRGETTADVEYVGLVPVALDGAIQQVEWSEGPEGATTRASRNAEFATAVWPYAERRRRMRGA